MIEKRYGELERFPTKLHHRHRPAGDRRSGGALLVPGSGTDGNLADAAMTAALRYRTQAPMIDNPLRELGLD
jgi:hypothetical protein